MSETPFKFRGRVLGTAEIGALQEIVTANPRASRRALSKIVCEAWDWRQPNGQPKDMVCRALMLALHRSGRIVLPEPRRVTINNAIRHRHADAVPVECALAGLGPIETRRVQAKEDRRLFNGLISRYHYLAYTRPVGEQMNYLVFSGERPIACLAWSSPPRHLAPRDRFIGWSPAARTRNLHLIAYNTRFLILPFVRVPHLASHLLGGIARRLPGDFESVYGHPVHYLETFIDPARFAGTCYRAANWQFLGSTTGRGHNQRTGDPAKPKKEVLGLPLVRDFRGLMGGSVA